MRLFELVDSDEQVLALIKPILIRARSEGADSVSMTQLLNDMDSEDNISADMIVDLLRRHRNQVKDLVTSSTLDDILLNKRSTSTMTTKVDQDKARFKSQAVQQAMDNLK